MKCHPTKSQVATSLLLPELQWTILATVSLLSKTLIMHCVLTHSTAHETQSSPPLFFYILCNIRVFAHPPPKSLIWIFKAKSKLTFVLLTLILFSFNMHLYTHFVDKEYFPSAEFHIKCEWHVCWKSKVT